MSYRIINFACLALLTALYAVLSPGPAHRHDLDFRDAPGPESARAQNSSVPNLHRVVLFGDTDDRREPWDVSEIVEKLAGSTVAIFTKDALSFDAQNQVYRAKAKSLQERYKLNNGERFVKQPTNADGSGALVGEDLVLTAGHMFMPYKNSGKENDPCESHFFVFGYDTIHHLDSNHIDIAIPATEVYTCTGVLAQRVQNLGNNFFCANGNCEHDFLKVFNGPDYAVIRLDRKVIGRKPLEIQRAEVKPGDKLFLIGYPNGLPVKVADNGSVKSISDGYFSNDLDTFPGNSGCPVLDAVTFKIVGIHVRGPGYDYEDGKPKQADWWNVYSQATPSTIFEKFIPFLQNKQNTLRHYAPDPAVFHPETEQTDPPKTGI